MYAMYVGRCPGYIVDLVTQHIILSTRTRQTALCRRESFWDGGYPSQVQCDWLLSRQSGSLEKLSTTLHPDNRLWDLKKLVLRYTHTLTHTHTYTHIHAHVHTCTHTHARTNTHTRTHIHRHPHTYAHTHTHACTHTHTYIYIINIYLFWEC